MNIGSASIGVLGVGAMGSALVRGWVAAGVVAPGRIRALDLDAARVSALVDQLGITAAASPADLASADVVLLAVKPGDVAQAVAEALASFTGLLISICAGVTIARLETLAPAAAVIRVMPNTAAMVGAAASGFARGSRATTEHAAAAQALLDAVGLAVEVKEALLNAVTGLSGSGPAYIYLAIEALADGGVRCGLPRATAQALAAQTVLGAARMVLETGEHPGALKDRVTSPAGTTIEGLAVLEQSAFRSALIEAVTAATERAGELG